jgi:hypothetical protein
MFPEIKIPVKVWIGFLLVGTLVLLLAGDFLTTLQGWIRIQVHPSLLITDYLAVGGLNATLLNAWLVTWITIIVLSLIKVKFSGVAFAGVLTIFAFSFFGKNLINILPVWFGFYVFARMKRTSLSAYTGTFLFATGIAPVTSFVMFGVANVSLIIAIPLGILSGIFAGWLTPMVVSIVGKFHQGYNLYNTGFGLGFIAMLFAAIFRALAIPVDINTIVSYDFHTFFFWFSLIVSLSLIGISFLLHRQVYRPWLRLLQSPGNLPSDFYKEYGLAATLFNVGTIGLFSLLLVLSFNFRLSGPMLAGIYTFMAFGSYGKHIRNATPVMLGLVLASTLIPLWNPNSTMLLTDIGPSIAVFFVTALAPVGGKFGLVYGILAGFIHLLIAPLALEIQGGFVLYNNGFTAGLVAGIIVVIAQNLPLSQFSIAQWLANRKLRKS